MKPDAAALLGAVIARDVMLRKATESERKSLFVMTSTLAATLGIPERRAQAIVLNSRWMDYGTSWRGAFIDDLKGAAEYLGQRHHVARSREFVAKQDGTETIWVRLRADGSLSQLGVPQPRPYLRYGSAGRFVPCRLEMVGPAVEASCGARHDHFVLRRWNRKRKCWVKL